MMLTAKLRRLSGAYSATKVFKLGSSPPIASPVMKRRANRLQRDQAWLVARVAAPRQRVARMIMRRRPMRSAMGPSRKEPAVMPARPLLKTMPNASGANCQSDEIAGAANEMASRSKPSSRLTSQQSRMTRICNQESGR